MSTHTIDYVCECPTCSGTGLYVGLGERDGAAVVCYKCKGTGKQEIHLTYKDFEGRQLQQGVSRVIKVNPGICVGGSDLSAFGGMDYKDWFSGEPFPPLSEMRRYTCPRWWGQCANRNNLPDWDECGFGRFPDCKHFSTKHACWSRWDAELAKGKAK